MNEFDQEINADCTTYEPSPAEIGFCSCCDVEISIHDAHDGLCAVCDGGDQ